MSKRITTLKEAEPPSLFDEKGELRLPRRVAVLGTLHGNPVSGYANLEFARRVTISPLQTRGVSGFLAHGLDDEKWFISPRSTNVQVPAEATLLMEGVASSADCLDAERQASATWAGPRVVNLAKEAIEESEARCRSIVESWAGKFEFQEEDRAKNKLGLRRPQIGALYAALAHWSTTEAPATIVMPTGTGKTETMLALLVKAQLGRLMVVVPNSALRDQIVEKFATLGKLPEGGCVPPNVRPPVVAKLRHRPRTIQEVDAIFRRANVVVSSMSVAGQCSPEVQDRMAELCTHLFIDEAHHIAARTWAGEGVVAIYRSEASQHSPVVIHSKMPPAERQARLQQLLDRQSRILICVDMFGEGFDLPQLKIAALHDRHKSLAITLQFVGRFTRDYPSDVGDAHVIANIADESTTSALRNLYAEDADWNFLLKMLSETATAKSQKRNEMLEGFTSSLEDIPLQTLFPRMSGLAYRTTCDQWDPMKVVDVVPAARLHTGPVINPHANMAIFITRDEEAVGWGEVKQIQNVEWNLHVLHWNEEQKLLFINSSSKDFHERIAEAVGGSKERIAGKDIFRVLGRINRLVLNNMGVSHSLGRNIRYTMFMGPNITEGLSAASLANRKMSNAFGLGYENDERVTVGCSFKGRLWSHQKAYDLAEWVDWCAHVGEKLLDDTIVPDAVFEHMIKAKTVSERPAQVPIMVAWPEDFQAQPEERVDIELGAVTTPLHECELLLTNHSEDGPLSFSVVTESASADFEYAFAEESVTIRQTSGKDAFASIRGRRKLLAEWFNEDPPIVYFASGDFLVFNELFELPQGDERVSFDVGKIETWDWAGVDLRMESQGVEKNPKSIQHRVIQRVMADARDYAIVFDGDGKGEVADVVAIRQVDEKVTVRLFHCKYSSDDQPGARIGDFYEVCCQAQKCVQWRENPRRMLKHLLHQQEMRTKAGKASRFERGNRTQIQNLINKARQLAFEYEVVIVQPGLKRSSIAPQFLDVLGATELFLKETFSMPLAVVVSD